MSHWSNRPWGIGKQAEVGWSNVKTVGFFFPLKFHVSVAEADSPSSPRYNRKAFFFFFLVVENLGANFSDE